MAVGDIIKSQLIGEGPSGEAIVNDFYFKVTAQTGANPTPTAVSAAVITGVVPAVLNCLTGDWNGVKVYTIWVDGANVGEFDETPIPLLVGSAAGDSLPLYTSMCVKRQAAPRNRRNRGRIFLSPIPEAYMTVNGQVAVTEAALTALLPVLATSIVIGTTTMQPALLHRFPGNVFTASAPIVWSLSEVGSVRRSRRLRLPN